MEEVKTAIERAESYLFMVIEQKWDSNNLLKDTPEISDWPLRFEAYTYLGRKDPQKKEKLSEEIRLLWQEWIDQYKKGELGGDNIFWPSTPNNEIENHVSMFRARDYFGIGGFYPYFTEAKNRIRFSTSQSNSSWQIVRSPTLKSELSRMLNDIKIINGDFISFLVRGRSQNFGLQKDNLLKIIQIVFSICFSTNRILLSDAKKAASMLIDFQEKNGSIRDSILDTCLFASSVNALKVDPSNFVCKKANEFILAKQTEDGFWEGDLHNIPNSTGWNVFFTVLGLETLNFINIDKTAVATKKEAKQIRERKSTRIQQIKPLNIPADLNWCDITIRFISDESVEIRASGTALGVKNFIELGFRDERTLSAPDQLWRTLFLFAKNNGELSWGNSDANVRIRAYIKTIRKRLQYLFGIDEDPFHPYKKNKAYKLKLNISVREDALD